MRKNHPHGRFRHFFDSFVFILFVHSVVYYKTVPYTSCIALSDNKIVIETT